MASSVAEDGAAEEGLSAYAMDTIPQDLLKEASAATSLGAEDPIRASVSLQNPDPAVVETLLGLDKVLVNRHLPRLQEWLRIFIKVDSQLNKNLLMRVRSCDKAFLMLSDMICSCFALDQRVKCVK